MAALLHGLMQGLGFEPYAVHGCDFGAYVTALMALDHPKYVLGAHMGMVSLQSGSEVAEQVNAESAEYAAVRKRWADRELGYIAIQSTKPQTLAYGLTYSPTGLAAWIAEKWRAWSDHTGPMLRQLPVDCNSNVSHGISAMPDWLASVNQLAAQYPTEPVSIVCLQRRRHSDCNRRVVPNHRNAPVAGRRGSGLGLVVGECHCERAALAFDQVGRLTKTRGMRRPAGAVARDVSLPNNKSRQDAFEL